MSKDAFSIVVAAILVGHVKLWFQKPLFQGKFEWLYVFIRPLIL